MCLATSRSRLLVTSLELVTEESVHNTFLPKGGHCMWGEICDLHVAKFF